MGRNWKDFQESISKNLKGSEETVHWSLVAFEKADTKVLEKVRKFLLETEGKVILIMQWQKL